MKSVKIGSVGLGRLGYEHARNLAALLPGCTRHAICDVEEERLRTVAEELNIPPPIRTLPRCALTRSWTALSSSLRPSSMWSRSGSPWSTASTFSAKSLWAPTWLSARRRKRWWRRILSWCSSWASCAGLIPPTPGPSAGWTQGRSARWCWFALIPRISAAPLNLH